MLLTWAWTLFISSFEDYSTALPTELESICCHSVYILVYISIIQIFDQLEKTFLS